MHAFETSALTQDIPTWLNSCLTESSQILPISQDGKSEVFEIISMLDHIYTSATVTVLLVIITLSLFVLFLCLSLIKKVIEKKEAEDDDFRRANAPLFAEEDLVQDQNPVQ